MTVPATWATLPTKRQLLEHIDGFLRAFSRGDLDGAFALCPPQMWVPGQGMVLRSELRGEALGEHLEHAMFQFVNQQSAVEEQLAGCVPSDPRTWCAVITPPADVGFEGVSLEFPFESDGDVEVYDAPDDAVASGDGEVLANVHLGGVVCDITARYFLEAHAGGYLLAFGNFDIQ
jgi:hypothetical protein